MIYKDDQPIGTSFINKDILSLRQFDSSSILKVFKRTATFKKKTAVSLLSTLRGKVIALIFYEPSSRTFGSFSAASKRLGANTIEYINPQAYSSVSKGETLADTVRTVSNYADAIVIRHPTKGAAAEAAFFSPVPVFNAGDGIGEHPTQALLDMFTIYEKFGRLHNLKGLMTGDLLNGRTVHSLLQGLSYFKGSTIYLLSPKSLRLEPEFVAKLKSKIKLVEITKDSEIPADCDFWYWTRVQKERFSDLKEYERTKHAFIVTEKLMREKAKKNMILMHPLPRVGEIETAIDSDPRAVYLTDEMKNGMYVRMALLSMILK